MPRYKDFRLILSNTVCALLLHRSGAIPKGKSLDPLGPRSETIPAYGILPCSLQHRSLRNDTGVPCSLAELAGAKVYIGAVVVCPYPGATVHNGGRSTGIVCFHPVVVVNARPVIVALPARGGTGCRITSTNLAAPIANIETQATSQIMIWSPAAWHLSCPSSEIATPPWLNR